MYQLPIIYPVGLLVGFILLLCVLCYFGHPAEESMPVKRASLPSENECIELANVVLSARGIEEKEVYKRARRLIEAVTARRKSQLWCLRVEFIKELVQHQAIYGQIIPPQNTKIQ